jgi:hypothetical protein
MADTTVSSSADSIRKFKIKDTWKDYEVTLEVNLERLTEARAYMINSFWTGHEDRADEEDGDVIRAVIRMAGHEVICEMLEDRGADFTAGDHSYPARAATTTLHNREGWGGEIEGDDFGWCGIRVIAADVQLPTFEDLVLTEVASA